MKRLLPLVLAAVLLGASGGAAADRPAGIWRMTVELGGGQSVTALLSLDSANGQWSGKCLGATADFGKENTLDHIRVGGDRLRFTLAADKRELLSFDGRVTPQGPIRGSAIVGGNLLLTSLEPSKLTKFDRLDLLKEVAAATDSASLLFETTLDMLQLATASKAKPEDVRAWTEKAVKAAEAYGARYQQVVAVRSAAALTDQPEFAAIGLSLAQRAERMLEPTDEISWQVPILETLTKLLRQSNKLAEAQEVVARINKLEEHEYQEYVRKTPLPFKPDPFAGRRVRSDRTVLMELFTGAESQVDEAAVLAFDALGAVYKPTEVVRLQYHLSIPRGPDPLTSPAAEVRAQYYAAATQALPASVFNGKAEAGGGGPAAVAQVKFRQYKKVLDPLLETPARAKFTLMARREGDTIHVAARVSEMGRPGGKVRLRIVLAEENVRYAGGNGIRYHHYVVRDFIGGPDGLLLKEGQSTPQVPPVNVDELRGRLNSYLDKIGINVPERPLGLHKLFVIGFAQDDLTQEVLQAVQVEVK